MDSFLLTTVGAISFILVTGVVGFVLAVGWYRATARGPLEKATIYFLAKMFLGLAICMIAILLIYRYS
jgi:hypothetical protein